MSKFPKKTSTIYIIIVFVRITLMFVQYYETTDYRNKINNYHYIIIQFTF